ncbi:hypothetical protein HUN08_17785 [Gordonia sp. X0973]|uniref:hypothetical protein n=1 Tax=Gordonia sp. X0973 TaxID=2742602 RepID=UPI000F52B16B|nr:hypothetical protein [Gordonia sp. X0973]QKT08853.1 hypothetical protein HUN08_17785 [Gordonia sp. X0973]
MTDFSANTDSLHHSGHKCNTMHIETHEVMRSACSGIESAVDSGWIGASAEAMRSRLEAIRTAGTHITGQLNEHSGRFHSTAASYTTTETHTVKTVKRAGSSLNLRTD